MMGKKKKLLLHNKNEEEKKVKKTSTSASVLIILATVILIGAVHSQHLFQLFENRFFFSALSPLERELSFRTEMGLYYSYYKTIITSPSFTDGLHSLVYDNVTEYPTTINTLQRFNLYPEVVLGFLYRTTAAVTRALKLETQACSRFSRGYGQPSIATCTGITVPPLFYVGCIFLLNSITPAAIFLLSWYLSNFSYLSGFLSTLLFFYNHGEATRVMWTPPLRESFSMPFLYCQLLALTWILRHQQPLKSHYVLYGLFTLMFMLPWQFAQFVLLTQVMCLNAIYSINILPNSKYIRLILTLMTTLLINIILQFANVLLLTSLFAVCLLVSVFISICKRFFQYFKYTHIIALLQFTFLTLGTIIIKILINYTIGSSDDAHIGALLLSKFSNYEDFHTQLYTCSAEFDFISLTYFWKLSLTLLVPLAAVVIVTVIIRTLLSIFITCKDDEKDSFVEASIVYHVLQCLFFLFMTLLLMRLKLFLTPHLCIIGGLAFKIFKLSARRSYLLIITTIGLASVVGLWNLNEQMQIFGEYSNPEMENLILWVNSTTNKSAVFAGSMPLMAAIKLTTGRPIVTHPHYENTAIRERTLLVYTLYSKRDPQIIYSNLEKFEVDYAVIERPWCSNKSYRPGCAFENIYLKMFPKDQVNPIFCLSILNSTQIFNFKKVYENSIYSVLYLIK